MKKKQKSIFREEANLVIEKKQTSQRKEKISNIINLVRTRQNTLISKRMIFGIDFSTRCG